MTLEGLLDAWRVNDRLNHEWLDAVSDGDLELKPGKGKTIRSNFTHIVLVRRMWVEERFKKEAAAIEKLDWKTATRDEIRVGLESSLPLMEQVFTHEAKRTKPTRWTLERFFGYCISHEAHHRCQIELAMRLNGREPDVGFLYGLWDWPKK